MPDMPSGTVTFVFTDIEGSTRLLKALGEQYGALLSEHRRLIRDVFQERGGQEIDTQGDAFFYSFPRARDAVGAAVHAQREIADRDWPGGAELRVRMGLHTGEPAMGDEGYLGLDVVRAARLASAGHGGQILLSETTRALLGAELPDGVRVRDLGQAQLKDFDRPEPVYELLIDGLAADHPPLSVASTPRDEFRERTRAAIEQRVMAEITGSLEKRAPERRRAAEPPGEVLKWAVTGLLILALLLGLVIGLIWFVTQVLF
jgi:class 3 adenylate cyclase